ncbi:MAG: hypothetical protein KAI70_05390, partial [Candidatus Omnitrophica bacterium]|nr:hypothetical protein [Candidatus Omnitrophota bacterium]
MKNRKSFVIEEPVLMGNFICLEGLSTKHVSQRYTDWLNDKEVCKENRHGTGDNTLGNTSEYVSSVDK